MTVPAAAPGRLDLVTLGRVSVDLYPDALGVGFEAQQTFTKSTGGSPTNVAVGAARLGVRSAALTAVGDDGLGRYVLSRLASHGVETRFVHTVSGRQTPLALVALDPPETPEVVFYRGDPAPDACLRADQVERAVRSQPRALWLSHATLAPSATGDAVRGSLERLVRNESRDHDALMVVDLDYRPALWADPALATARAQWAIGLSDVVVANLAEAEMALGSEPGLDPDRAADGLLEHGAHLAVVKLGPDGVLMAGRENRLRVPAPTVEVVCGLGAGDAFGASLVHGLLAGDDLVNIAHTACAAGAYVASRMTCSDDMPTRELLDSLAGAR